MKSINLCAVAVAVLALTGCISKEAYLKEYKEASGLDVTTEGVDSQTCSHWADANTPEKLKAATLKCAQEESGKPMVNDKVLYYSELNDGYQLSCFFGGYDRTLILDRLSKGVGLVQPVYLYGDNGSVTVDWPTTEKLIALLKSNLKLNVRPLSESKAYDQVLSGYRAPKRENNALEMFKSMGSDPLGNKHYTEVVSKFPSVDYIIAPSQDVVNSILTGDAAAMQEYFKLAAPALNADDPSKRTFKRSDIRDIQGANAILQSMIVKNSSVVNLEFQLTERMKAFNDKDQTFTQRIAQLSVRRGCSIADLNNRFVETQFAKAEVAGENKKTFAQRLADMVQIDTSRGLEVTLSDEQGYRDQFDSERKKLAELKKGFMLSMNERYQKMNGQLAPFAAKALQQFKVTGFTQSKKL